MQASFEFQTNLLYPHLFVASNYVMQVGALHAKRILNSTKSRGKKYRSYRYLVSAYSPRNYIPLDMLDNSLEHVRYTNLSSDPAPCQSIISSACSQPEINLWQGRNIFLGDKGDLRLRDNSSLSIGNGLQSTWTLTIETFSLKRHGQRRSRAT